MLEVFIIRFNTLSDGDVIAVLHMRDGMVCRHSINKLCGRPPQYAPAPCKLTFDVLTLT